MKKKSKALIFLQNGPIQVMKKEIRFAKDQIKETYDQKFRNERNCLFFLNRFIHLNIIFLFDFYIYKKKHNFLFFNYEINFKKKFQNEFRFKNFNRNFTFFLIFRGLILTFCNIHKFYFEKKNII